METIQKPINSGFGAKTTAAEALGGRDLTGKTAIVTGGYSGIGTETTRVLAAAGANVVVPARNPEKARANLAGVPRVEFAELDLLDPASIDAFAAGFLSGNRALDILVNNAGIMATPFVRDARGYESQFSANHLGHFQLTRRLFPALAKANGARVVSVSSRGHRFAGVDFDDPNFNWRPYDKWLAYGQSKTANILFARALDEKGKSSGVRAFSVHPGNIVTTDLGRFLTQGDLDRFAVPRDENGNVLVEEYMAANPDGKTVEQGAATSIWCAANAQLDGLGGVYCENCDVAELVDDGLFRNGVRSWAVDPESAQRLWELSEELTGVSFAPATRAAA